LFRCADRPAAKLALSLAIRKNPLVTCWLSELQKRRFVFREARGTGNPVIYVGAKTGRDGIHGASLLASAEFTEESKQKRPNVQVGDPFMEKPASRSLPGSHATGAVVAIQTWAPQV